MSLKTTILGSISRNLFPKVTEYWESQHRSANLRADYAEESLTSLQLEIENLGYTKLASYNMGEYRYTRRHITSIIELASHMALKNPITCRTVNVQADYVFGQGISFKAKHPWIQEVIDEFVKYRENRKSLTSHTAMLRAEKKQQVYGSMFFALYTNTQTGRVIVRIMPTLEVVDIITDPDDRDREWYIKHTWTDAKGTAHLTYHPCLGVDQYSGIPLPWEVPDAENHDKGEVIWNAPVLHVAYNKLGREKFAIPELYPQLDWAVAYKRFLEDWTSIIRAFARMAMKITGLAGKKQAAAAKSLFQTSVSLSNPLEKNPSPAGASTAFLGKGVDMEPIRTAGSTTPADQGDPVLNMAGCGVGLPNTFYGDAGKGNFATAKTLDRPTELKMRSRQKLWEEIFTFILDYVIRMAAIAPEGILANYGATYEEEMDVFDGQVVQEVEWPLNKDSQYGPVNEEIDPTYEVHFPELLERDVADRVRSLVNAVSLFGKPLTDIIPDKRLVALLLLQALNIQNAESYIPSFLEMWKVNSSVKPGDPPAEPWIIPPAPNPSAGGAAEDPSQGGAVGTNG